jgi:uncharacterized protein YjiS (DUF1127 family)
MTSHHAHGALHQIAETFRLWRERMHQRRELTQWTERDMHDAGLSRGEVLFEAGKPFWRA